MFILRRVTNESYQTNEIIGKDYSVIYQESSKEAFEKTLEIQNQSSNRELIYGFIVHENGQQVQPLFNKSKYYIMTENGHTFANLSSR